MCARGRHRKPESHPLGCFPHFGRSCHVCCVSGAATCASDARFCSPALWSQPVILGGFDAFLLRCVRSICGGLCAFRGCCVERGRRIGRRMSVFGWCLGWSRLSTSTSLCMTVVTRLSRHPARFSGAVWPQVMVLGVLDTPAHVLSGVRVVVESIQHSARI